MRIVMISQNDPAGMGIAFTMAINRYSSHSCRLITTETRYNFGFEKDLHLPNLTEQGLDEARDILEQADLFHFHLLADEHMNLGPINISDYTKGKKIIHHHHGHPHFRANPGHYREKYKRLRRKTLVSTPDLLHLLPEATWIPNLVDIDDPLLMPTPEPEGKTVVIGHSPTRKDLKNTADLEQVVSVLERRRDLPPLHLRIIENRPHRLCLAEKRNCHLIFDHMQGYYGVSSLESLSQGRPVVAGLDEWNIGQIKAFTGSESLPWIIARNTDQLGHALASLAVDSERRQQLGQEARTFMEGCWHPRRIVRRLSEWYRKV